MLASLGGHLFILELAEDARRRDAALLTLAATTSCRTVETLFVAPPGQRLNLFEPVHLFFYEVERACSN